MSETINHNLIAVLSARRANGFAIGNTGTHKTQKEADFGYRQKQQVQQTPLVRTFQEGEGIRGRAQEQGSSARPQRGQGADGLRSGHTLGISAMPDRPRRNVQVQEGAHGRQEQSGSKGILAEARQVKKEDERYDEFERRTGFRRERTL